MAFSPVMALENTVNDGSVHSAAHPTDIPGLSFIAPRGSTEISPLASPDLKTTLQRRFTSESITGQKSAFDMSGMTRELLSDGGALNKAQLLEQTKYEHDILSEQKRKILAEVHALELQQMKKAQEIRELSGYSEPATPPEHRDGQFRAPNLNMLATPPATIRLGSNEALMTPPSEQLLSQSLGARSVGGSRRNSDEEDVLSEPVPLRQRTSVRNSIASAIISRPAASQLADPRSIIEHGQVNTYDSLFTEDDKLARKAILDPTSPDVNNYLKMSADGDKFPVLLNKDSSGLLSASSAALDLAVESKPKQTEEQTNSGWPSFATHRHRHSQHSLPSGLNYTYTPPATSAKVPASQGESPVAFRRYDRGSVDLSYVNNYTENQRFAPMPKLQSSFSTSDLPTMRSLAATQAHNIALSERHRRESSTSDLTAITHSTALSGGVTFGPPLSATLAPMTAIPAMVSTPGISPMPSPGIYGYGPMFHPAPFGAYPFYPQPVPKLSEIPVNQQPQQIPAPAVQRPPHKRNHDSQNRFANMQLENLVGEIYSLCKDQHGCRYLQKKLEERNPAYVDMIFRETQQHVVELMTDPFGNYLVQKLLEFATDQQRTVLVNNAAPDLVKIALNQHGTRALQKMIEYVTTRAQTDTVIKALKLRVVDLIQDLNGNHVVQKCLNRLSSEDAQFIYDAVMDHCIAVGTHRHGCCVLQRCVDHASPAQKVALVSCITAHAITLVQDPFGNYVVQYILDLDEPKLAEPLICRFKTKVCLLSKQKFSSNVIEKCIRVAEPATKRALIEEMLDSVELEKLLRDSFANYVIQTALEYAEPNVRHQLVENIKPLLPAIRLTPYGRRIQSKIQMLTGGAPVAPGAAPGPHFRSSSASYPSSQGTLRPGVAATQYAPATAVQFNPYFG